MECLDRLGGSQGKTYHYRLNELCTAEPTALRGLMTPEQLETRMREADLVRSRTLRAPLRRSAIRVVAGLGRSPSGALRLREKSQGQKKSRGSVHQE
jgi:hypothetical protein